MSSVSIFFSLPLKTTNPLNGSQGFSRGAAMGAAKRRKEQRIVSAMICSFQLRELNITVPRILPCSITLTRVAPSNGLDPHDALPSSLKACIDGITDAFGLKNDRDERVKWKFKQRRGPQGLYSVEVLIESD